MPSDDDLQDPQETVETYLAETAMEQQRSAKIELILWAIASLAAMLYTYLV